MLFRSGILGKHSRLPHLPVVRLDDSMLCCGVPLDGRTLVAYLDVVLTPLRVSLANRLLFVLSRLDATYVCHSHNRTHLSSEPGSLLRKPDVSTLTSV